METESFESLNPEEQEKIFHKSSYRDRGDLLFRAHEPEKIARSLSHEEFYLLTREMDLEEKAELLKIATLPQLFFLSDIDCWHHDQIAPQNFIIWLESLLAADEKRLLKWLVEMDYETVVTGLKKIMVVTKPEWEYAADETLGDRPYFTLDEQYHIYVKEENLESMRRAIQLLFENHRGRYVAILEGILSELEYEVEEEALRRREMRLAERGFPELERAQLIYQPITKKQFEDYPLKKSKGESQSSYSEMPNYMTLWSEERMFLDDVLLLFRNDPEANVQLQDELAWLSNKVIASKGIDLASEERVKEGISRARAYVSLGLEILSNGDLQKAEKILRERWLEAIFRWGMTQVSLLRKRAVEMIASYCNDEPELFLRFLRKPYDLIFRGLLQASPLYFDPMLEEKNDPLRDFQSLDEITRTEKTVEQMEHFLQWLKHSELPVFETYAKEWEQDALNLYSFLGNLFAQYVLKQQYAVAPLSVSKIKYFVEDAFEKQGKARVLKADLREKWMQETFGDESGTMRSLLGLMFNELEEEFARLNLEKGLDARYLSSLWIK